MSCWITDTASDVHGVPVYLLSFSSTKLVGDVHMFERLARGSSHGKSGWEWLLRSLTASTIATTPLEIHVLESPGLPFFPFLILCLSLNIWKLRKQFFNQI